MALRVALAQQHAGPDRTDNLRRALEAMDRAADAGAGLIVFPEVVVDRFFPVFSLKGAFHGPSFRRWTRAGRERHHRVTRFGAGAGSSASGFRHHGHRLRDAGETDLPDPPT